MLKSKPMRKYITLSAAIAALNILLYPFIKKAAFLERGYDAIGGEALFFVFGFIVATLVLMHGVEKTFSELELEEPKDRAHE